MRPNGAQQQSSPTNSLPECPGNLLDFQRMFPDEAACLQYLKKILDIVFVGGKTKGGIQGKTDQVPVMIAVEIRRREVCDPKTNKVMKRALAGRIRLQKLPDKSAASVDTFAKDCLAPGAAIVSDDV